MTTTIRIIATRRVVLPGTRHTLIVPGNTDLHAGLTLGALFVAGSDHAGVGTLLDVRGVRQESDLVAIDGVGSARFRVVGEGRGGQGSEVELLDEATQEGDDHLTRQVKGAFRRYQGILLESGREVDLIAKLPANPVDLSYRVASLIRLTSPERQELLESGLGARLRRELALLRRETALLETVM